MESTFIGRVMQQNVPSYLSKYPYVVKLPCQGPETDEWIMDNIEGLWVRDTEYAKDEFGRGYTSDCIADIFYFQDETEALMFRLKWS
jgi:hypothetical protein